MTAPAVHPVMAQRSKWTNKSSGKSRVSPTKAVPDTNFVQPLRRPLEGSKQVAQYQLTTNLKQRNVSQLQGVRPPAPTPPIPPPPKKKRKKRRRRRNRRRKKLKQSYGGGASHHFLQAILEVLDSFRVGHAPASAASSVGIHIN